MEHLLLKAPQFSLVLIQTAGPPVGKLEPRIARRTGPPVDGHLGGRSRGHRYFLQPVQHTENPVQFKSNDFQEVFYLFRDQ